MSDDLPQNFETHRVFPTQFAVAFAILAAEVLMRGWAVTQRFNFPNVWAVFVALALVMVCLMSRRKAQLMQDRIIRLEMRLRLERLLGPGRLPEIDRLTLRQLVALRFASDDELPNLVDAVLSNEVSKPDDIKRRIKDWQADWLRV